MAAVLNRTRVAIAGLLAILIGNLLSVECSVFELLALVRFGTGLGAGVSASVMAAVLSSTLAPERSFAFYAALAFLASAAAMWLSGLVLAIFGVGAMFAGLAAVALVPMLLSHWLPARRSVAQKPHSAARQTDVRGGVDRTGATVLLGATVVFYAMTGGIYSFMGQMGLDRGVSTDALSAALGFSQIGGAVGSLVPLALSTRAGRAFPIAFRHSSSS